MTTCIIYKFQPKRVWRPALALLLSVLLGPALHFSSSSLHAQQMTDTPTHSEFILAVDEYSPAPGQWVGEMPVYAPGDTPQTMADKCTRAIAGPLTATSEDDATSMISLGAWGGYVTFHFDHSIANIAGQRDFYIAGNALVNFSEAGIVMVMKDENHNGLPDDTWYELAGSADEDSAGLVRYDYRVTYTLAPMADTPWTDSEGQEGAVLRNAYHEQNEYFPLWLDSPLTFTGTRLPDNAYIVNKRPRVDGARPLRYGYVDNLPNSDEEGNSFDIDWAVDHNRMPVSLDFIDFVRVYTAHLEQVSAAIGESSTEVQGARDLHLDESIRAIAERKGTVGIATATVAPRISQTLDMQGRPTTSLRHGLNIVRTDNGECKKIIVK